MEKNSLGVGLFILAVAFLVVPANLVFAATPVSITINTQPASSKSVDFAFSQQPVLLVQDANKNPVPGVTIAAVTNGAGNLSGGSAVTDANGVATFSGLSYDKTDSFAITFFYINNQKIKVVSNSLKLSVGEVSKDNSKISATPDSVTADGKSLATITILCQDQYGNMITGANVGVLVSGNNNTLAEAKTADSPGVVTVNLSSTTAEPKIVSATINGVSIGDSNKINFVPGQLAKLLISAESPIVAGQKSKITVTGQDGSGNDVVNDSASQIVLSADNGGSLDSALITLLNGKASAVLSKTSAGQVNLTASAGSNINIQTQVVFVSADSTAPTILSQFPESGAQNVPVDVIPYLNFSKAMDATKLTTDNVQLKNSANGSVVPADVLVANGAKRVILQPSLKLEPGAKYYLFVSKEVSDLSGNILAQDYKSNLFSTALDPKVSAVNQQQDIIQEVKTITKDKPLTGAPSSSINVTSGSDKLDAMNIFRQAGLLGAFKNFDINKVGGWLVANFAWIIIALAVVLCGYIFWFIYVNDKR